MALTLLSSPANYQLSKNPIILQLQTDKIVSPVITDYSSILLIPSGANVVGGNITFIWAKGAVLFTVATTPDDSGTQVRPKGAASDIAYAAMLVEDMSKNYNFYNDFNIVDVLDGTVFIYGRKTGVDYDLTANFWQVDSGFIKHPSLGSGTGADVIQPLNYKMIADLWMETTLNSDTYTKISVQQLSPLSKICAFDFQTAINANLSYYIPAYTQVSPVLLTSLMKRFYIRYAEQYGNPVQQFKTTTSAVGYALKAGVPNHEFVGTTGLATSRYITPGKFLTRQPRTKMVSETQKEFLYFITPATAAGYTGNIKIRATLNFKNHATAVVVNGSLINTTEKTPVLFPCGFTQLNLSSAAAFDKIKSYTLTVIHDGTGDVISEVFTYIPDTAKYLDENYLYFSNSDSGLDTVRFTGVKETGFTVDKELVKKTILFNTSVQTGEFSEVNHNVQDVFKINTGWITKAQADWLEDFFIAEKKLIDAFGKFIPITISTITQTKYDSVTGKTAYLIEYSYANTNPVIKSI